MSVRLTAERARALFTYDAETGALTRRITVASNAVAGSAAGSVAWRTGYIKTRVDGELHRQHRLIWLVVTGAWPNGHIDHINGVRSDNRWQNLRDVTSTTNNENRRAAQKNNASRVLGVSPSRGRFRALIRTQRVQHYLGTFNTTNEAHEVYLAAKRRLHAGGTL